MPQHNDPYAKTEPGLSRLPRWRDSSLGWDEHTVQAAIDRRDTETLLGCLVTLLPTYCADALGLLNVKQIDKRGTQAEHRIEDAVSECMFHAQRHLPDLLKTTRTPQMLAAYYRLRSRSLAEDAMVETYCRVGRRKRADLEDYPDRPPRYAEATGVMSDLAMRMAGDDLRPVLVDIFSGRRVQDAVRMEAQRRKGRPAYPRTSEACRAGIWRQLAALGAAVMAAAPDWALDTWMQKWGGRLLAA